MASRDSDVATDELLAKETKSSSSSRGTVRRAVKLVSNIIIGERQPSRSRVLYDQINSTSDLRLWTIQTRAGATVRCASVHNPTLLNNPSTTGDVIQKTKTTRNGGRRPDSEPPTSNVWTQLVKVERLEIEDAEGMMTELPRHFITDLHRLTSLTLTWTKVKSLPVELFLNPIKSLHLQRNQLRHLDGIDNADQLITLDISCNVLEELPTTIGKLKQLVTLNASENKLRELPESIGELEQLSKLDCTCNRIRSLPDTIGKLDKLTCLLVGSNKLANLPESIGALSALVDFSACGNAITALPASFAQLKSLRYVSLRKNRLESVPLQLRALVGLENLNLRENRIRAVDVALPPQLITLILDNNELNSISNEVTACGMLEMLSLRWNKIRDVPDEIVHLGNLHTLDLSGNYALETLPDCMVGMTALRRIGLNITDIKDFPPFLLEMTQLRTVELNDCDSLDPYVKLAYSKKGQDGIKGLEGIREYSASTHGSVRMRSKEQLLAIRSRSSVVSVYPDSSNMPDIPQQDNNMRMVPSRSPTISEMPKPLSTIKEEGSLRVIQAEIDTMARSRTGMPSSEWRDNEASDVVGKATTDTVRSHKMNETQGEVISNGIEPEPFSNNDRIEHRDVGIEMPDSQDEILTERRNRGQTFRRTNSNYAAIEDTLAVLHALDINLEEEASLTRSVSVLSRDESSPKAINTDFPAPDCIKTQTRVSDVETSKTNGHFIINAAAILDNKPDYSPIQFSPIDAATTNGHAVDAVAIDVDNAESCNGSGGRDIAHEDRGPVAGVVAGFGGTDGHAGGAGNADGSLSHRPAPFRNRPAKPPPVAVKPTVAPVVRNVEHSVGNGEIVINTRGDSRVAGGVAGPKRGPPPGVKPKPAAMRI